MASDELSMAELLNREKAKAMREVERGGFDSSKPPVTEGLDRLGEGLDYLTESLLALEKRFDAVLRKNFEASSDGGIKEAAALDSRSEVNIRLNIYNQKLNELTMLIRDIIDRAEV